MLPEYVTQALDIQGFPAPPKAPASASKNSETIWRYNSEAERMCAVSGGVCMYSDEGYVLLGTKAELAKLPPRASAITVPLVVPSGQSLAEHIINMLNAMTYDGTVFWAKAWDTNVVEVVRYKLLGNQKDISYNGQIAPLWQVINECRTRCDAEEWCKSFSFPVDSRVCTLSADKPKVTEGNQGDIVVFVQNDNYNRDDYVLS